MENRNENLHFSHTDGEKGFSGPMNARSLLVFNMAIFNFDDGWNRIFNQFKIHENGT
jgi:hypothetical protein